MADNRPLGPARRNGQHRRERVRARAEARADKVKTRELLVLVEVQKDWLGDRLVGRRSPSQDTVPPVHWPGGDEIMKKAGAGKEPLYAMTCGCGFELKDHAKVEFVEIAKLHIKKTHKQTIDEKAILAQATIT